MNVYDFDKTIFYPDSSVTFFLYCLKRHPGAVLGGSPGILRAWIRYERGKITTKDLKEKLFAFLSRLPDPEAEVERFWDENFFRIGQWYLDQKREDDLIITASPEFLVGAAGRRLGVTVLGTRMDARTGRIDGENCHDEEKCRRFSAAFPDAEIEEFYSDSLSDAPMARLAEKAFLVKNGKTFPWHF